MSEILKRKCHLFRMFSGKIFLGQTAENTPFTEKMGISMWPLFMSSGGGGGGVKLEPLCICSWLMMMGKEWWRHFANDMNHVFAHLCCRKPTKPWRTFTTWWGAPRSPPSPRWWPTTTTSWGWSSGSLATGCSTPAPSTASSSSPESTARTSPPKRSKSMGTAILLFKMVSSQSSNQAKPSKCVPLWYQSEEEKKHGKNLYSCVLTNN